MMQRYLLMLAVLSLAAGCAHPPEAVRGDYADVTVPEALARPSEREPVRWGGELVETRPEAGRTCFEIIEHPLDRTARPRAVDESSGRFVACARGFYDPAVWTPGRAVTAAGAVDGTTTTRVGGSDATVPRVDARGVYLWPPEPYPDEPSPRAIDIGVGGWGGVSVGGGIGIGF
jgi:outer membrane lipoprotein